MEECDIQTANTDNKSICNQASKHDRNSILDYIRAHAPITQYRLAKELGINRTTIYQVCKEFEFCNLIEFKVVLGENNRAHKLICIPDGTKMTDKDLLEEENES